MTKRLPLLAAGLLLAAGSLYADDAEDMAVKAVEKLGGNVTHDDSDPAHAVVAVVLITAPVTDRGLKDMASLKRLHTLNLALCLGVTDKGLKDVAGWTALRTLNLSYTGTTDDGLKLLTALTGLRELNLIGTKTTDAGVAELHKALPDCKITHAEPPATDKDLEGDWEAVSFIHEGKEEPQAPGKIILTFRGDAMTLRVSDDDVRKAAVTVDTGKSPRWIDMAYENGPDKGKTIRGRYEVKGDELRICHGNAAKERPTEIASREGSGYSIGVWKRVKK